MKEKPKGRNEPRPFAKDIRQWVNSNILDRRSGGDSIFNRNNPSDHLQTTRDRLCGICMNSLVVFGLDFSLKCFHAVCWSCTLRLRYLLKRRECPFCKNSIESLLFTSNPKYFEYLIDDSLERFVENSLESERSEEMTEIRLAIGHPKLEAIPKSLIDENNGVIYESKTFRLVIESILEIRCWFPGCRPKFFPREPLKESPNKGTYKSIRALGEHLFQEHHVKCCYVCIENRKTMLLPEHFLYGVKDLSRHMKQGEMSIKPPIPPHVSCPVCKKWCLDKEDFSEHVRSEHFSCHICEEKDTSQRTTSSPNDQEGPINPALEEEQEAQEDSGTQSSEQELRINYVYRDYQSLQEHWKRTHFPCDHENCLFIVFENEAELVFHKATQHSAGNRRGNITVPIAMASYRQQTQRREEQGNSISNAPQANSRNAPLAVSTPSLCAMDELSNSILLRIKKERPLLWRLVLVRDLSRSSLVIEDELKVQLGLEEKCKDFNTWSLNVINTLYSRNEMMVKMIHKLGSAFFKKEISSFSFISELVLLLWGSSQNYSNNMFSLLQNIKKTFKNIPTSPVTFKTFYSPVSEPVTIFEDSLRDASGTYRRIPSQLIDRILIEDANWSLLYSDVTSMVLISLVIGLPSTENRRDLLKALVSLKEEIQKKKLQVVSNTSSPRFTFGNIKSSLEAVTISTKEEENNPVLKPDRIKSIKQRLVSFERLVKPDEMLISPKVTFLESLHSFLSLCFSRLKTSNLGEFLPKPPEKEEISNKLQQLIGSQTSTEINALSSLYQHAGNLVSSANTIERILGLRAPYYRLAVNVSVSTEESRDCHSDSQASFSESLAHRQWLNICVKAFNKICIYDIEIVLIYCNICAKTLSDPNFLLLEKQREDPFEQDPQEKSFERIPKTVNASSEVISHPVPAASTSSSFIRLNSSVNWATVTHRSSNFSTPKTVVASPPIQLAPTSSSSSGLPRKSDNHNYASKVSNPSRNLTKNNDPKPKEEFPELVLEGSGRTKPRVKSESQPKWTCMLCTHVNAGSRNRCQICSTKK
ncbi:zinc finger protein 598 [Cryptosporidium felis]|nr:zinc finger protein 598 [Cryptosporidium felis]